MAYKELMVKGTTDLATGVATNVIANQLTNFKEKRIVNKARAEYLQDQADAALTYEKQENVRKLTEKKMRDTTNAHNLAKNLSNGDPELEAMLKKDISNMRLMDDSLLEDYATTSSRRRKSF